MPPKFSVISVYNDAELLDDWLLSSLDRQDESLYETVLLDNQTGEYGSAAEALNKGADMANGEYYMFVHQDVRLLSKSFFEDALSELKGVSDLGIAGVSGLTTSGNSMVKCGRNVLYHGEPPDSGARNKYCPEKMAKFTEEELPIKNIDLKISNPDQVHLWGPGEVIEQPVKVQTVDELLTIVPAAVFSEHQFNPEICSGWHFYAVELALRLRYNTSYNPYVLPITVWHRSKGMAYDDDYYNTLDNIISEYNWIEDDYIYTTTGIRPVSRLYSILYRHSITRLLAKIFYFVRSGKVNRLVDRGFNYLFQDPRIVYRYIKNRVL